MIENEKKDDKERNERCIITMIIIKNNSSLSFVCVIIIIEGIWSRARTRESRSTELLYPRVRAGRDTGGSHRQSAKAVPTVYIYVCNRLGPFFFFLLIRR